MTRPRELILGVGIFLTVLWVGNVMVEAWGNRIGGPDPAVCGQLQHGDSWRRFSWEPLYTPFWLDDPCRGIGFREPFF